MMRTCNGKDPNLTRECEPGDPREKETPWHGARPCDCGLTFDDRFRLVIFPHEPV